METENCITVTHFINPHLFWYKTIEAPDERLRVLSILEQSLSDIYKNKPSCDNFFRPQIGDKVAVNFIAWNKFIRAEILHKAEFQQEEYIVWALDYGFPLLTKKEYLRTLPTNLQIDIGLVQVGGIANVYPAEQEYDDMEGNLVMIKKDKWLQKTCNVLEKLLADANSISFFKHYQTENGHVWGELIIVNHKGIEINAREYLLKTINAIKENDLTFKETCSKFKTTKIAPWLSNDRNTKMKFNNIKHNYIEHSKQMNITLVDENAKRKVEDWQKRNEKKLIESASDMLEATCDLPVDNVDDVSFDDSVSVALDQQVNYIGKAGVLTKIKQQKYSTAKDLPPSALPKSFEIDGMLLDVNWPTEQQQNSHSSSSDLTFSSRLEKLSQLRIKHEAEKGLNKHKNSNPEPLNTNCQIDPLIDLESTTSSMSSMKQRQQKLFEMRKTLARVEKQKKMNESTACKPMCNQNETTNSTTSQAKTLDSYPYQLLEQSSTLSTLNNTSIDKSQDNKSESSIKNVRVKQLLAMRKKFGSSAVSSSNGSSQLNTTRESQFSTTNDEHKDDMNINNLQSLNDLNFQLKPKTIPTPETRNEHSHQMYTVNTSSKNIVKESLKLSQCGYDRLTMVPAGYDVTRLQTYKDEENHWHRKKSTRNDYVPHEQTSSTDELISNNINDQSSSSSEFFQLKSLKGLNEKSKNQFNGIANEFNKPSIVQDSQLKICKQRNFKVGNNLSSELSISSNSSSILSQKSRKRRQLQSPTSQLLKIDKILQEHNIEKELGNSNILDLKLLNTSSSSQKSVLTSTSSNISSCNRNIPTIIQNSVINNSSIHSSFSKDNTPNEKALKDVLNYQALKDVKNTEYLPKVEGEHKIQTNFIDHLVLAHSSIQLAPIENILEAPFLPEIHEEMRQMRVNKVFRIQVYSWSHILRNNSLFVINPSRSGKTWSYLPPLCSLICCRKDLFKPSYGPVAIILVASLKHVELVQNYCRRLMSGLKSEAPTCIPSYGLRNLIETKLHLLNGCGILVATPSNILRLLNENNNESLFDAERLQHIIIDDMDIMMSRAQQDFEKAYKILFKMAKKSKEKKLSPQLIVTSRDWDGLLVKFIRKSNQPLLLIGDFLEAAVYGHATLSVKLKSNNEKNDTILKFLKEKSDFAQGLDNRTLIICNDDDDVQNVYKFLQDCGYPCLCYYSRSTENERVTIDEWKKKVSFQILVCTDARFSELKIQNVNNLIHYSMPSSWTQFTLRFSAFARTYNNYVSRFELNISTASSDVIKHCAHSMILLDENNNLQLPRLVDFMRKHNQKVQDEILAVSKRVLIQREEERILNTSRLCPQLLEFGECDETRCDNRHELTQFDCIKKSDGIPCSGEIRIHVLKVFSPTYYSVRLLHHKRPDTNKWLEIRRSSEALTFSIQLNMHYCNDNNLFLHWPPHINDLCIYQYAGNFRRARILDAPTFQEKGTNVVQADLKVTLRLIDDGTAISSVKCNEIFVCDEKFKDFPPQAVDVRLMNVVPFDNERTWDIKTTKQVQKWIEEDIKSNYVVQANIDFSLANTIWVRNVVVMEKLTGIDAYCQVVNLKKSLVEKNFGVLYNGDRKHVRDLAEEYGLLNSSDFDIETGDSDPDYRSCQNESIDLIRFSSSNDESTNSSMKSAESNVEQSSKIDIETNTFKSAKSETITKDAKAKVRSNDEEDWDDNLESSQPLGDIINQKSIEHENNSLLPKKETWSKLTLNELVKVEIGDEGENGNWENIFLQIIDKKYMFLFEELNKLIINHVEKFKTNKEKQKEIYEFEPLHNCIVKYNNQYLRAKVYGVYGENLQQRLYKFFLCDYACFTNVKANELYNDFLYKTTEEIVTFTPYQAVHCTLAGVKWDRFTKRYQVTKDYLYACAVLEADSNPLILPIHSYKILLYECENENEFNNALLFNKALINNGITVYDEETKSYLEYELDMQQNEEHKLSSQVNNKPEEMTSVTKPCNKDEVFTYEQLIDLIKSNVLDVEFNDLVTDENSTEVKNLKNNTIEIETQQNIVELEKSIDKTTTSDKTEEKKVLKGNAKMPTSDSEIDEQGNCTSYSNSSFKSSISLTSTDASNCSESESPATPPPSLKALHKRPLTTWYQNDCMIFISIYAPDVKDYLLEVAPKTVLFMYEIQSEKFVLFLNFLGSIDPKSVSHEIKGLNVVIRLQKNVFVIWPRLLKESTKYSWLKYNFNAFDSVEMEYIMPQQLLHTILENDSNFERYQIDQYNSDEDSERELYQTYNPIQSNDDECDPFA